MTIIGKRRLLYTERTCTNIILLLGIPASIRRFSGKQVESRSYHVSQAQADRSHLAMLHRNLSRIIWHCSAEVGW